MAGKVLGLADIGVYPDKLGEDIARKWHEWQNLRRNQLAEWEEIRKYVFATDTTPQLITSSLGRTRLRYLSYVK
jgi:hypothetical protein